MRLASSEVLDQAEGSRLKGKGFAAEKELQPAGSRGSGWVYTELYWEAQNGNPGFYEFLRDASADMPTVTKGAIYMCMSSSSCTLCTPHSRRQAAIGPPT
jgi:hypothetical protein